MPPRFHCGTSNGLRSLFRERRSVSPNRGEPVLDIVRRELPGELHQIAILLRNGCQNIDAAYFRNESSRRLQELTHESSEILHEVRRLAIECSAILTDTTQSLELALTMPPHVGVARELQVITEMQQRSLRSAEEVEERIIRLIQDIQNFIRHTPVEARTSLHTLLAEAVESLSRLVKPIPALNIQIITVLDNSSVPGLMELLFTLLPTRSALLVDELIEGRRMELRPERFQGEFVQTQRLREFSLLKCAIGVGYNLRKDLLHAANILDPTQGRDGRAHAQRMTTAFPIYTVLRESLMEFSQTLVSGNRNEAQVPSTSRHAGTHPVVAWLRRPRFRSGS